MCGLKADMDKEVKLCRVGVVRCDRDFNNARYAEGDPVVNRNYTVAILLKESCLIK